MRNINLELLLFWSITSKTVSFRLDTFFNESTILSIVVFVIFILSITWFSAAIDTIDKLKENISSGSKNSEKKIRIKICFPTSGKDPDEIFRTNPVEWEEMINLAQNFIDYLINYYSEIYLKGPQKDTYKFLDLILING